MSTPLEILKQYWGYDSFRDNQAEIINATLDEDDVIACLPTGSGKSVCYQVPALLLPGLTLVISPLVSLIVDQVDELKEKGIAAGMIHSGMRQREIQNTLDLATHNYLKLLYISPERLLSKNFKERIARIKTSRVVIDEAHCVSQWGQDFRPAYQDISIIRETLGSLPFMALTATATTQVRADIVSQLKLCAPKSFIASSHRPNLSIFSEKDAERNQRLIQILHKSNGTGIIYCTTRNTCVQVSDLLKSQGIRAEAYHGGLKSELRQKLQHSWKTGKLPFLVSTNAFGMGVNKPDVRTIIHYGPSRSIEDYYQEIGRAGRDGKESHTMLLWNDKDFEQLQDQIKAKYPEEPIIKKVYQALSNYFQLAIGSEMKNGKDFDLFHFSKRNNFHVGTTYNVINCLEKFGLIKLTDGFRQADKVKFLVNNTELYNLQLRHKNYDLVIKGLIRLQGAPLFNEYKKIDINKSARLAEMNEGEFRRNLVQLSKLKVLDFIPAKDSPQLSFTTPRLDADKIKTDQNAFNILKNHELDKLNELKRYCELSEQCRFQFIHRYFGEENTSPCLKCDNCRRKAKAPINLEQDLLEYIKTSTTGLNFEAILTHFKEVPQEQINQTLRLLIEQNLICRDKDIFQIV